MWTVFKAQKIGNTRIKWNIYVAQYTNLRVSSVIETYNKNGLHI